VSQHHQHSGLSTARADRTGRRPGSAVMKLPLHSNSGRLFSGQPRRSETDPGLPSGWPEKQAEAGRTTAAQAEQSIAQGRWPRPCRPMHPSQIGPDVGRQGGQASGDTHQSLAVAVRERMEQGLATATPRRCLEHIRAEHHQAGPLPICRPPPPLPPPPPQHVGRRLWSPNPVSRQVDSPPQRPASQPIGIERVGIPVSSPTRGAESAFMGGSGLRAGWWRESSEAASSRGPIRWPVAAKGRSTEAETAGIGMSTTCSEHRSR